jgi:hypothetical protein
MALENDYQRVAERALLASQVSIDNLIQEKAAFLAYHAFESTGSALCVHNGIDCGINVKHKNKIENFSRLALQIGGNNVAIVAMTIKGMRNKYLYPFENKITGGIEKPEDQISIQDVQNLKNDIEGIYNWVGTLI